MSLHDEMVAALAEVLAATGDEVIWKKRALHALVSDNPLSHDLGFGRFEASRAERDSQRAEPLPEGQHRTALAIAIAR